jgi:hypothetical protein
VPPSIRNDLNYGKMAALVVIEQDSHILTLTGVSLDIMQLVEISHTVLVPCNFEREKNQIIVLDYRNTICHIRKIELMNENIVSFLFIQG